MVDPGDFYFSAQLHSLNLKLSSSYDTLFTNGIKLLKSGFKGAYPEIKEANGMQNH